MTAPTRPVLIVAAVLSAAALLGGCATAEPAPPEPAPLFATDEEALAAAAEAYREYLRVVDDVMNDGGDDSDRLRAVTDLEALESELNGVRILQEQGIWTVGSSYLLSSQLVAIETVGQATDVRALMCVDFREVFVHKADSEPWQLTDEQLISAKSVTYRYLLDEKPMLIFQDLETTNEVCREHQEK